MRYWHRKVNKTAKDTDFEEDYLAFNIGKAFHKVLEDTKHTAQGGLKDAILNAVKTFNVEEHKATIHAMVIKYLSIFPDLYTCLHTEFEISTEEFIGYIDAVVKDKDGWYLVDTRGSHRQYKHNIKAGRVTIAGKPGHDLPPGTLNSILKQAQLKGVR